MSTARPGPGVRLCALDDLADPGAKGFVFEPPEGSAEDVWPFRGVVLRIDGTLRGYVDSCPHVGVSLSPDGERYLTKRADFLMCFNHGALFRVEDGMCVAGTCVNRALRPWPVEAVDGAVVTA